MSTHSTDTSFFGHPRGLATLFFTEMWERFSYYGMRALLLLFMVEEASKGGLGFDVREGSAIYGLYTMFVYLLALPGGWLADKYFGLRKSIYYGGIIIAAGHFSMAIPTKETFFFGLFLIVVGTGLLKPNVSSVVGGLYSHDEPARRDAGYSIYYMGINIGAFIAPLITGWLGEGFSWHYGFGAAGIGMVIGVVQYKLTEGYLGEIGLAPESIGSPEADAKRKSGITRGLLILGGLVAVLLVLLFSGTLTIDPVTFAGYTSYIILGAVLLYFIYIFTAEKLDVDEKKKVGAIAVLFLFSAVFWSGFEQAGSSLNLFAYDYTDRFIGSWEMPASWLQSVNPIFIILLSPVFGWLWITLAKRQLEPATPIKFSFGIILLGLGFGIMALASEYVAQGDLVLPTWLIFTYFFHTAGELSFSPIGMSAVTKLAPKKLVGQMMGVWFMSLALGNLIAGLVAGEMRESELSSSALPELFWSITQFTVGVGIIMLIVSPFMRRLMGNVR
ncbi:MAG: peptide MFS transporter [Cyclobacteriaceae bacterium]